MEFSFSHLPLGSTLPLKHLVSLELPLQLCLSHRVLAAFSPSGLGEVAFFLLLLALKHWAIPGWVP